MSAPPARPRIGPLVIAEGGGRPTVLRLYDDAGGYRDLALDLGQLAKLGQTAFNAYLRATAGGRCADPTAEEESDG